MSVYSHASVLQNCITADFVGGHGCKIARISAVTDHKCLLVSIKLVNRINYNVVHACFPR